MGLTTRLSTKARDAQLDALAALATNGFMRIYTGTQPVSADLEPSGIMLAELRLSSPAFLPSVNGIIEAADIQDERSARETGLATWFRIFKADGVTPLWDGSVGANGANFNMNSPVIQKGSRVMASRFIHTLPAQGV